MAANAIDKNTLTNEMDSFSANALETGVEIPTGENIMIFKGLASQNYKKGGKNRNGYKIDPNGRDFSNYMYNPIILLQHNAGMGGIGKAIKFDTTSTGLNILFYVDLNTLDERTRYQVSNGYISAISTGHITEEDGIEDVSTGKVYSIEDAMEKFGRENVRAAFWGDSEQYIYVVTKAQAIENSLVTIGSNEKAIALPNAIGKYAVNKYSPLLNKMEEMSKNLKVNTEDTPEAVVETPEVETPTEEVVETPEVAEETPATTEDTPEAVVETPAEEEAPVDEAVAEEVVEDKAKDKDEEDEEEEKAKDKNNPEVTSENKAETAAGDVVVNAVEKDQALVELQNSLSEKDATIAEQNTLLEQATEAIEKLNKVIEDQNEMIDTAKNYITSLGGSFDPDANANGKKTILENRLKMA